VSAPSSALAACALALALAPAGALADVRLDVRAEPTAVALTERVTLQVTVQSSGMGSPNVELPDFDGFEVLSRQVQRNFVMQSGVQLSTVYTFVLQPLREGRMVIEPVRAERDGKVEASAPIAIVVGDPGRAPASGPAASGAAQPSASAAPAGAGLDAVEVDPIAFVRTTVDKPQPYEGEQVTVNIYLYVRDRLQSNPSIETEPTTDGLWVHDLLPPQRTLQPERQIVNGSAYIVYLLRRVAAFPLHAGAVTIGPMTIEIDTSSLFDIFSPQRARQKLKRSGLPVTMDVKPLPAAGRPKGEVAVGRYTLAAKLDRQQAATGDAVTLTALVEGQGNIRTVALELPKVPGLDVLQPETKDLVTAPNDLVSGTREYRWLLVARTPGRFTIPALTLNTFDPASGRYQAVTSPPLQVEVVGQALAAAQPTGDPTADDAKPETADDEDAGKAHVWAPIRTQSALERESTRLVERAWYGWALAAPALLWLAVIGAGGLRRVASSRAQSGPGRALRDAEQRLQTAGEAARDGDASRFYAEASAALIGVLEARMHQTLSGHTRAELRQRLLARGLPQPLANELIEALERSDFARFGAAPASPAQLQAHASTLRPLFERLAAFTPSPEERS
jgi:hypothetical protein